MTTWRDHAHAVIQQALEEAEAQGLDAEATKRHVNAAYPFGERAYHPYKIWRSEMRRVFGTAAKPDIAKLQAWNEGRPL